MAHRRGLRVIAGSARGRRLRTPTGGATRPMSDRVREAVFSALDARGLLVSASVLDLFAGSGALAIESLSRGAARAVLVERDRAAAAVAAENLRATGFGGLGRVEVRSVEGTLRGPPPREAPFDLVFVDPPYALGDDEVARLLEAVAAPQWSAAGARLVVHRRAVSPPVPRGWRVEWERTFGDTLLVLIARDGAAV
jgi:16S rRNA (guanine966-N2)-methyltransferase